MYVTVTDDPLYTKGAIVIEGPTSEEAPRLEGAISKDSKNFRPPILGADHKISKKDVAIWQKGPPSPEESDAHSESGRPLAQTWLPDQRYGFATVNATTVKVHENSTVEWRIAIQQDARTPISDRKFEGLERNTVEQVKQDLDLPATFHDSERLRRDIRHRLPSTGKFYAVHVWPDAPFAPKQAIPLNVQVLE